MRSTLAASGTVSKITSSFIIAAPSRTGAYARDYGQSAWSQHVFAVSQVAPSVVYAGAAVAGRPDLVDGHY